MGAFLAALQTVPPDSDVLDACARAMLSYAETISLADTESDTVDVVGTGGDGMDTFNVSTAAG